MTDADAPVRSGGPQWARQDPLPQGLYPAAVSQAPLEEFLKVPDAEEIHVARFQPKWVRHGGSPIPYAVASGVALIASVVVYGWAAWDRTAPRALAPSLWWSNVMTVLLPSEIIRPGAYDLTRMWIAIGVLSVTALVLAAWMARIGHNVRPENGPFGMFVVLVAFPAWWTLPLVLGGAPDLGHSDYDDLVRFLIAFGLLFAQALLFRWTVLNRIWRAGRLPYDMASILLWLPNLVAWSLYLLSSAYTIWQSRIHHGKGESAWRPTQAMIDVAQWTTRISALGILVLLVAVSVAQHQGMKQDKVDEAAFLAR